MADRYPESELVELLVYQLSESEPRIYEATTHGESLVADAEAVLINEVAPASSASTIASSTIPIYIVENASADVRAEWRSFIQRFDVDFEMAKIRQLLEVLCNQSPLTPELIDDFDDALTDYRTKSPKMKYAGLLHLRTVVFRGFIEPVAQYHGVPGPPGSKWFRKILAFVLGANEARTRELEDAVSAVEKVWKAFSNVKDGKTHVEDVAAAYISFVSAFSVLLSLRHIHYRSK